jgi:hypothetical protein
LEAWKETQMEARVWFADGMFSVRGALVGLLGLAAGACSHPQRPYEFSAPLARQSATTLMADALLAEGQQPAIADPRAGMIVTAWQDTGYRVEQHDSYRDGIDLVEKIVYRRYQVAIVPGQSGAPMTVRLTAEAKRCLPDVTVTKQEILGQCETLTKFIPALQRDLDRLGARLEAVAQLHAGGPPSGQRPQSWLR